MAWLNQVAQITLVNVRSIPHRLGSSLVVVIGIAGVVGVLVSVLASVCRKPSDIASTETSTPTTPAMPTTTTSDVPTREGRLRRFMSVMAKIWVSERMS